MIKNQTKIDKELNKEISKKFYIISLINIIVGSIGLLAYIVLGIIYEVEPIWVSCLLIFALPFGFGLVFLLTIKKILNDKAFVGAENIYEFEDTYFNISTIKNGENIGTVKVYYKEITKRKETKNYLLLFINQNSAFGVDKRLNSENEVLQIKALTGFKVEQKIDLL